MVHHCQDIVDCIPEEILGFGRELPEASCRGGEPSPRSRQTDLWPRARQTVATAEQLCPKVAAGELLCTVHYDSAAEFRRLTPYSRKKT